MLVAGCAGAYGPRAGVSFGYVSRGRPHPRYFCADCHGVRYFDPYYDLCMRYGYRFDWRRSPEVVATYRRDYVRIRRSDPTIGRYRYPRGARERARERFEDEAGRMPRYEPGAPDDRARERPEARESRKGRSEREKDDRGRGRRGRTEQREERGGSSP
jgi:hypothetical protein